MQQNAFRGKQDIRFGRGDDAAINPFLDTYTDSAYTLKETPIESLFSKEGAVVLRKEKKKKNDALLVVLVVLLLVVIAVCGYRLWAGSRDYRAEKRVHEELIEKYRPARAEQPSLLSTDLPQAEEDPSNPAVAQLCADYPDAVGWLTVPGTDIDYPFVYSEDNQNYLHKSIDRSDLYAGTVFMDCHCRRDFSSQNTILYGHNMQNGTMFHSLTEFKTKAFFDENRAAYIYLPDRTLTLDIFAAVITDAADEDILYNRELPDGYLDYVQQNALCFRDPLLTEQTRLVTLSTCTYEFDGARMVLLCTIRDDTTE